VQCPNCGHQEPDAAGRDVVVTNIRMPFWSMVVFIIKWSIAAIPAMILLWFLGLVLVSALGLSLARLFKLLW